MYVDKTGYIRQLVDSGKYYFLSCPRRFGKSLPQLRNIELHYHNVLYLVFMLMGYSTRTEYRTSRGRTGLAVCTAATVYIFELKLDRTPEEALAQINNRDVRPPLQSRRQTHSETRRQLLDGHP